MKESICKVIQETMRSTFADPTITINLDTSAEDVGGWDSLAHARLILALEQRFSVAFPAERLFDLRSVSELVELIEGCQDSSRHVAPTGSKGA